jgi:uncharacterized membrane protein
MADSASILCPQCFAQMPETAAFCPGCGRAMKHESPAEETAALFQENVAGALAYFTLVPAIIFVTIEPYKRNRFVRFHAAQCLLFCCATVVAAGILRLLAAVASVVPIVGPLFTTLIWVVSALAVVVVWFVLVIKALQEEMFKLPILGDYAEHWANSA